VRETNALVREFRVRHSCKWELQVLRREISQHFDFEGLVGRSPAMQAVAELTKKVAPTNATLLITGESGVGKEVVARLIHSHSLQ